jgi:hypothetical protein
MTERPLHPAEVEALAMAGRGERNDRCVLAGVHGRHVFRVRRGGPSQPYRDAPCGGGAVPVDKEADREVWDR